MDNICGTGDSWDNHPRPVAGYRFQEEGCCRFNLELSGQCMFGSELLSDDFGECEGENLGKMVILGRKPAEANAGS